MPHGSLETRHADKRRPCTEWFGQSPGRHPIPGTAVKPTRTQPFSGNPCPSVKSTAANSFL